MASPSRLLGESPGLVSLRDQVGRLLARRLTVAGRLPPILILGETGSRERGERGYEVAALLLQAEVGARSQPSDTLAARQRYEAVLARAHQLEMRPLAAQCHLRLGRVLHEAGHLAEARPHLEAAATLARDLGMRAWPSLGEPVVRCEGAGSGGGNRP